MNLPDSFYIALCMTILLVGAVYWVWTQIQYVQRKVNVLENIVYELKTLCAKPDISPYNAPSLDEELHETLRAEVAPYDTVEEVAPFVQEESVHTPYAGMEDTRIPSPVPLADAAPEIAEESDIPMQEQTVVEPIFDMSHFVRQIDTPADAEDLQPGGVGSGIVAPSLQSSLDGMTIKELRRLAQQKGISGNDMKKKDLIEAIRAVPIESFLE